MAISVVIPVYNAQEFVKEAVKSAMCIKDVKQIILVEDSSPDNCLNICKDLQKAHPDIIELYTHPQGTRQGAAASRNLGIGKATGEYIAFLDADDYYLPHRFDKALKVFEENLQIDYVVSPSQLEPDYLTGSTQYTMMTSDANNKNYNLFPALLTERYGFFDTNSIIIRRSALEKLCSLFKTNLELHQDSELWLRIAYQLKGYSENKTLPGSVVRRHAKNRITNRNAYSLQLYWSTVFLAFSKLQLTPQLHWYIRLRKKYYKHLNAGSLLSFWYWAGMKLQFFFIPSKTWSTATTLNRYATTNTIMLNEEETNILSA